MTEITLTYFDFRGRSEAIRLLLEDAKVAYKDTRLSFDEWPAEKSNRYVFLRGVSFANCL